MKVRTGGKTIDLEIEGRVRGAVVGTQKMANIGSNPTPSPLPGWPKRTDKWNYAYAVFLDLEKTFGRVNHWWFEPFSLWLPGQVRYKPDFLIQYPDYANRRLEFVEVKGWSRNLRDGITRYKLAAALFPCFAWRMVKRKGNGWEDL